MDFLISNAWAQDASATSTGGIAQFLPLIILFAVFYLFLIRPQMKRQKDQKNMVEALAKGDEIVTNGGLLGKIIDLGENFIVLEVAKEVEVKVQRHAVSATMPEGTIKTL